jgi:hypothetical protein
MRLILNDTAIGTASENMNDDAYEIWRNIKNEMKYKAAPAAFYSRHNIKVGDEYIHISFVDTETGEVLYINCLPKMHTAMIDYEIYPEFILNGLKRTV